MLLQSIQNFGFVGIPRYRHKALCTTKNQQFTSTNLGLDTETEIVCTPFREKKRLCDRAKQTKICHNNKHKQHPTEERVCKNSELVHNATFM